MVAPGKWVDEGPANPYRPSIGLKGQTVATAAEPRKAPSKAKVPK